MKCTWSRITTTSIFMAVSKDFSPNCFTDLGRLPRFRKSIPPFAGTKYSTSCIPGIEKLQTFLLPTD